MAYTQDEKDILSTHSMIKKLRKVCNFNKGFSWKLLYDLFFVCHTKQNSVFYSPAGNDTNSENYYKTDFVDVNVVSPQLFSTSSGMAFPVGAVLTNSSQISKSYGITLSSSITKDYSKYSYIFVEGTGGISGFKVITPTLYARRGENARRDLSRDTLAVGMQDNHTFYLNVSSREIFKIK